VGVLAIACLEAPRVVIDPYREDESGDGGSHGRQRKKKGVEQAYRESGSGKTEAGMWGIIKKIKVFSYLEKERLGEARSVLAPYRRRVA
jgi:hypothetical protein